LTLSFRVLGVPVPQGSKKGFVRGGRVVLVESSDKQLKPWREAVAHAAQEAHGELPPYDGAIWLEVMFVMPRPASARKRAEWHVTKPDSDKLLRALGDSLTMSGVIRDDARLCDINVKKRLADRDHPWTGAEIRLGSMPNGEPGMIPCRTGRRQDDVTVQDGLL
jgi:Holliday junction resolvase RusA-like endonuclease